MRYKLFTLFVCLFMLPAALAEACTRSAACRTDLANSESGGNYSAVNSFNFLGKYQFGEQAMADAGYYVTNDGTNPSCSGAQGGCDWNGGWTGRNGVNSVADFLACAACQEDAQQRYEAATWSYIQGAGLDSYLGSTVGGIPITCDALLNGYHLKGNGGLITFLSSGGTVDPSDGYGTSISSYMAAGNACSGIAAISAAPAAAPVSCDENILSIGEQLREARMNAELNAIKEIVDQPPSVAELSCQDQFAGMFGSEIGAIFTDVTNGLEGLTALGSAFNFSSIGMDAISDFMTDITATFSNAMNSLTSQIDSAVSSLFGSILGPIFGSAGNVDYTCDVMNLLWEIIECQDIFDFDIPSLGEILDIGGFIDSLLPSSCAGQALFNGAIAVADITMADYSNSADPVLASDIINTLRSY